MPGHSGPNKKLLSTEKIVQRLRVSYPLLRAAKFDPVLRQLFLSELISQVHEEKG